MHRLPLPDELPYHFQPPKLSPFWVRASRLFISYSLRRVQFVRQIDASGLESLAALAERRDGVLITPNHPDLAENGCIAMPRGCSRCGSSNSSVHPSRGRSRNGSHG